MQSQRFFFTVTINEAINKESSIALIESLPLDEIYRVIQKYKLYMNSLKESEMLIDDMKQKIVKKIDYIF